MTHQEAGAHAECAWPGAHPAPAPQPVALGAPHHPSPHHPCVPHHDWPLACCLAQPWLETSRVLLPLLHLACCWLVVVGSPEARSSPPAAALDMCWCRCLWPCGLLQRVGPTHVEVRCCCYCCCCEHHERHRSQCCPRHVSPASMRVLQDTGQHRAAKLA